jgi:hypothetical protein
MQKTKMAFVVLTLALSQLASADVVNQSENGEVWNLIRNLETELDSPLSEKKKTVRCMTFGGIQLMIEEAFYDLSPTGKLF